MKKVLLALLVAILTGSCAAQAAKPLSPIQVNISPAQAGISPENIKPGDVVELRIAGKSFVDSGELGIKIELIGGAELVSGETAWTGTVEKGGEKAILITVRSPKHGGGGVRARAWMSPSSGATFAAEAKYLIGPDALKKPELPPGIKKDHKGREIREYRVN